MCVGLFKLIPLNSTIVESMNLCSYAVAVLGGGGAWLYRGLKMNHDEKNAKLVFF